jgi:hypothetical protein
LRLQLHWLRIRPAWTPDRASWLNLIDAQFGVLKKIHSRQHE